MTSILTNGKYRQRKDWSTNSIPALVSLEEEVCGGNVEISSSTNNNALPPKPPRRSSLAIGLLAGRGDKFNKRRSSIGVSFLGRRDSSSKTNKETSSTYETAVRTEKSDGSSNSPDIIYTHSSDTFNSSYDDDENGGGGGGGGGNGLTINNEHRIRRSSWQTKLERRKRRNLDTSPGFLEVLQQNNLDDEDALKKYENDGIVYNRQKRHSWWNIFIPDQRKQRSRRASQDVGIMSRSADSIASPRRSKSRSVDHGLATPFDLDSLRSKVEGRFESVDRLTKDGEKKKTSLPTIPTKTYTVGNRDTLTSVAARFDTTPSELTQLNRLNSNFIYPGQQLLVPDKTAKDGGSSSGSNTDEKIEEVPEKSSPEAERKSNEEILTEEKGIF